MKPRYLELLRVLTRHDVRFIVVGGVAAILEGAPISTLDLDVVYAREPANLERLSAALRSIHARYRDPAGRVIEPSIGRLATMRMSLLLTDLGPLDVLAELGERATYDELLGSSKLRSLRDLELRVLELAKLIELKEQAGREKDLAVLPVLKKTLEIKRSRDG